MPSFIDTHAHLHMIPDDKRAEVIERAKQAGVKKIVNVACNVEEIGQCLPLTDEYDFIWTTAGIHPTDLSDDLIGDLEKVYKYAKTEEKVVGIGEMGLDYYHDKFDHDTQINYLVGHINIAKELDLPAVIHTRAGKNAGDNAEAFGDLIKVLKKENFGRAVSHCFSGNKEEAKALLDLGALLSFTGIITYPNNEELREIAKETPLEKIVIETDSPFLTPQGQRGKKNEPAFVTEVAQAIADAKGISIDEVAEVTTKNAELFFGI